MTDQTTATPAIPLGDALRDIAASSAGPVDGWDLEALAARADELQAKVDAHDTEPVELTPVQYALLDAVKDVARAADAPAALHAGKQLVRLAADAFDLERPEPEQVVRAGGLSDIIFGRPVNFGRASGGPINTVEV